MSDGTTSPDSLARDLSRAGYERLFYSGEARLAWRGGENSAALEAIARDERQGDLPRLLAAEVLRREGAAGAPQEVAPIYARALALSGLGDGPLELPANEWGFMYGAGEPHGALGARLLEAGPAAVPHLAALLDDARPLLYVGSKEATVGNALGYRVKDAAAYYLGAITGQTVAFHEDLDARDAEIERLRAALA